MAFVYRYQELLKLDPLAPLKLAAQVSRLQPPYLLDTKTGSPLELLALHQELEKLYRDEN